MKDLGSLCSGFVSMQSIPLDCPIFPAWYPGNEQTNVNMTFTLLPVLLVVKSFVSDLNLAFFCQRPWHCSRLATIKVSDPSQFLIKSKVGSWIYKCGVHRNGLGVMGPETSVICRWRAWTLEANGLSKVTARLHRAETWPRCTCLWLKPGCEVSCLKSRFFWEPVS